MMAFPAFRVRVADKPDEMLGEQDMRYLSNKSRRENRVDAGSEDESGIREGMRNNKGSAFTVYGRRRIRDIRSVETESEDCQVI